MNFSDEQNKRYIQTSLIVLFVLYWLFARYINRMDFAVNTPSFVEPFLVMEGAPRAILLFIMEMAFSRVVVFLIPFGLGWYFAQQAAVGLVQDLFDLPDSQTAASFLARYISPDAPPGLPVQIRRTEFKKDRLQKPLLRYGGPGIIQIDQGDTVTTERNGRFVRVLGPGLHKLGQYEYVRAVIDTRPQERAKFGVSLYTRDGIEIKTDLVVTFHIGRGGRTPEQQDPFPYEAEDVHLAAYTEIILEDGHMLNWEAMPILVTTAKLREIVSKRSLDRLLYPVNPELKPHEQIKEQLEIESRTALKELGVDLVSVRLGRLEVPDAVTRQRIEYWRAYWHRQQREKEGSGEAEAHLQLEAARGQARAAAVKRLMRDIRLEQNQQHIDSTKDVVALRLVEAMSKMAQQAPQLAAENDLAARIESLREQLMLESGQSRESQ